jgi:hypothetical protein
MSTELTNEQETLLLRVAVTDDPKAADVRAVRRLARSWGSAQVTPRKNAVAILVLSCEGLVNAAVQKRRRSTHIKDDLRAEC